jgi:GT2 family glycosyltransferase
MESIVIITVNYRGADSTALFLESASQLECFKSAHVIVVENGSCDGSAERLRPLVAQLDNVELLESAINRGYFGGANWALQQYLTRGSRTDWVIICNNDILFDDRQFLSKLFKREPENAQVIAPAIIARLTGLDCNPFLRKRLTAMQLRRYRFWYSNYYLTWIMQLLSPYVRILRHLFYFWRPKPQSKKCERIYAAHGSFLIFSRAYFDAGGYVDDGFFLYAEEFSVAEICLRLGLRVVYDPDLRVWHYGNRATGRRLNRSTFEHTRSGLRYALKKYMLAIDDGKSADLERAEPEQSGGIREINS